MDRRQLRWLARTENPERILIARLNDLDSWHVDSERRRELLLVLVTAHPGPVSRLRAKIADFASQAHAVWAHSQ